NAEAGVEDRLHEHGQQRKAGDDEAAVANSVHRAHAGAKGCAEYDEIERGRDYRSNQALPQGSLPARHLEPVDGCDALAVHAACSWLRGFLTSATKISSRLDWWVERSL